MVRKRERLEFCFITPGSLCERYASLSKTHLVLPQVDNPAYVEFYQARKKAGDFIILDNGAYEGAMYPTMLEDAIARYEPHVVALPDHLLEKGQKTFLAAREFLNNNQVRFPDVQWMYIPQAQPGDINDFNFWLEAAIDRLPVKWFGLPRAMATHIWPDDNPHQKWARANWCEKLTLARFNVHGLGMVRGSLEELRWLSWEGARSCDSSAPVWRGLNQYSLLNAGWSKEGTDVNFNWEGKLGLEQEGMIQHNVQTINVALGRSYGR